MRLVLTGESHSAVAGRDQTALPQDGVEEALEQASELIKLAMRSHQDHRDGDGVERLTTPESRGQVTRELAARSRLVLRCVAPPPDDGFDDLVEAVAGLPARGTRVHMLCTSKHLAEPMRGRVLKLVEKGVHVRVASCLVPHLVVADGGAALLGARLRPATSEAIVVRTSAILLGLQAFFFNVWSSAANLTDHAQLSDRSLGKVGVKVLSALSAGRTDDVAARELGMSVRTYRRHVADIMRELNANSRFEAGARAATLGLLSAGQCAP